jgi:hypothetical protein
MHLKLTFSVFILLCCHLAFCQNDTLLRFLDYNYHPVPEKGSAHPSICIITALADGGFSVNDFHAESGKILSRAYFTDRAMTIRSGPYETFFPSGKRKTKGFYKENKKIGPWKNWHDEGQIRDSAQYDQNGFITGIKLGWNTAGRVTDSASYGAEGRGHELSWFPTGVKRSEGDVINESKTGLWKFYHRNGLISAEETYVNDSAVAVKCFDEKGNPQQGECFLERDAEFPGGTSAWTQYIVRKIEGNFEQLEKKAKEGTIYILFIIDVDGKVTEASVINPTGNYLEEYGLRIIRSSPKWIPAKQHNIFVKAYRRQPISFQMTEE